MGERAQLVLESITPCRRKILQNLLRPDWFRVRPPAREGSLPALQFARVSQRAVDAVPRAVWNCLPFLS